MDKPMIETLPYHRGISMHHIPVEGAAGLLFAIATVFIFAVGIPAVREMLVATVPLGLLGAALLLYWHKGHPLRIHTLDLRNRKHSD